LLLETAAEVAETINTILQKRTVQWNKLTLKHTNQNQTSSQ
jgi:hypothetical protein